MPEAKPAAFAFSAAAFVTCDGVVFGSPGPSPRLAPNVVPPTGIVLEVARA